MGAYIIKLGEKYLVWSTVVDAPVTCGMDTHEEVAEALERRGEYSRDFKERIARVDATGTSCMDMTVDEIISYNRAGHDEKCISKAEIIKMYCT